ncbi:MAG: hypothetical protein RL026_247 [Pseudomonadota bacterium]
MPATLGELAVRFGCELRGDPDQVISAAGPLDGGASVVAFAASAAWLEALRHSNAGAVIVDAKLAAKSTGPVLVCANPHATFARVAAWLHPEPACPAGVHPSAVVDPAAHIDPSAHVGALCVIEAGARLGPRVVVGPQCHVGRGAVLAEDVRLRERVTVCHGVQLGARSLLHPGCVIGSDGFGNAREPQGWVKVPQLGSVTVGCDVEIGANTTIDRGALGDTVIGDGVRLDNQIQVGHNVVIGEHTAIAAGTGIAGSAIIGRRCMIGGAVGINGHITICDDVVLTGASQVSASLHKPGLYSSTLPVEEARTWRRIVGRLKRIDNMVGRLTALERATGLAAQRQEDADE